MLVFLHSMLAHIVFCKSLYPESCEHACADKVDGRHCCFVSWFVGGVDVKDSHIGFAKRKGLLWLMPTRGQALKN